MVTPSHLSRLSQRTHKKKNTSDLVIAICVTTDRNLRASLPIYNWGPNPQSPKIEVPEGGKAGSFIKCITLAIFPIFFCPAAAGVPGIQSKGSSSFRQRTARCALAACNTPIDSTVVSYCALLLPHFSQDTRFLNYSSAMNNIRSKFRATLHTATHPSDR